MSDKRETSDFYPNVRDGIITPSNAETWVEQFEQHARAALASEENAAKSAEAASNSATYAALYAKASSAGASAANESANAANESANEAQTAQGKAEAAATASGNNATEAKAAATAAGNSATAAADSAKDAGDSAVHAEDCERAAEAAQDAAETAQVQAQASETAAKASETAAKASETAASASEQAAKASEQAAAESATAAAGSANAAKASETAAAESATSASDSATAANASANAASSSATAAAKSAAAAASSASAAKQSETDLAEAVATAESLDSRLTEVEEKKIATYNPLEGSPFIVERIVLDGVYKVRLRKYNSLPFTIASDGKNFIVIADYGRYIYILDGALKPVLEMSLKTACLTAQASPAFLRDGKLWTFTLGSTWMPSTKTGIISVFDVSGGEATGTLIASKMKIIDDYTKNDVIAVFVNDLTGNVLCIRNTMVNTGAFSLELYRLTIDGDTFAYEFVQTLEGVSSSLGNNPFVLVNYFANRAFLTLVKCTDQYSAGSNPYGYARPTTKTIESRLLVTGYDDCLHWVDTASPPAGTTLDPIPIRFGVKAAGLYFDEGALSNNILTACTPGFQYRASGSYTDKNGSAQRNVLMTNGLATFWSNEEDEDGNLVWKTNSDWKNWNGYGFFTPAVATSPSLMCPSTSNGEYIRPTALCYRPDVLLGVPGVGDFVRLKTTGDGGNYQNGMLCLGDSDNVGNVGGYGSRPGPVGSVWGVACHPFIGTFMGLVPYALVFRNYYL